MAVATLALLMYRLVDATAPVPTGILLTTESASLVSVQSLDVDGQPVLPHGWTAPERGTEAGRSPPQATADLRVGRPARVSAALSVPRATVASCQLAPRPYGECLVVVRFLSPTDLRCEFDCKTAAPKE